MKEEKNINKNKSHNNKEKDNPQKPKIFFIFILALITIISSVFSSLYKPEKIEYTQFLKCVNKEIVESVEIDTATGNVEYKLKNSDKTYTTNYPYTDNFVEMLLLKNVDVTIKGTSVFATIFQYMIGPITIFACFGLIYFISANKNNKNDETVKSTTTFKDVAGMDEVKEDLLLIANMMKDESLKKSGARIPRGILLEGPPGNGKTLLARAFAGETGVNFIALNACDTGSPFVGIGSMKIKSIFDKAKKKAPCVIFIDELDAIGSKRSEHDDSASKEMNTVLTSLLNQMDGFTPTDDIMVIAATNRADSLDPALVRPGRFDRKLVVNLPDKTTREELFRLYINKSNRDFDIDISKLATKTYGCSSSEIECIVNEAIINSIKHKEQSLIVNMSDFEDAILSLGMKGHIKKKYKRNEEDNKIVAYHEAGHAVATYFKTNKVVSSITITPTTSGAGGFTVSEFDDDKCLFPIDEYYNEMIALYAGRAAEYVLNGENINKVSGGASNDIQQATKMSINYVELKSGIDHSIFDKYGVETVMKASQTVLQNCWKDSVSVVKNNWKFVEAIAKELLEKEKIEGNDFLKIIKEMDICGENNTEIQPTSESV